MALRITVMLATAPRTVQELALELPDGATVRDACTASGGWPTDAAPVPGQFVGVWGRKAEPDQPLQDGDRVELVRDLRVDPKVARRERFAGQGARGAGLFSRRRPGAKSGY
jgi:putative ubiquitin-RnfH superfamily antitoxin RatB of RatAB toxin-antitoxin module